MTDTVTLYTNPWSRGRMIHWLLEEAGVDYAIELISFDHGEHKRPEFLAINPMGKVPAIVHRGTVVTETAAICAYIADAFPDSGLAPAPGDPARGTWYRWLFFAAACVEHAVTDKAFARPPAGKPGTLGYGSYEDVMNTLEKAVTPGPWLLGERFTSADVYVGGQIAWGLRFGTVEARPAFEAYAARLNARPAHQRVDEESERFVVSLQARSPS